STETLNRIELAVAKVSALQGIALWHMEQGGGEKASDNLDLAVAAAKEIEHGEEKIRALGEIAVSYIDAKKNDKAVETYSGARDEAEILTSLHRDVFLSGIAIGFLKAGDIDLADAALDLVADKTQMSSGLLGFARIYWERGEKEDANEALEEAYSIARSQKDNEIRDSRASDNLMGLIAAQYASFGKPERAIEVAQENRDDGERVSALARIAQTSILEGNDDASQQAIRGIEDEANRVFSLIGVAEAHAKLGDNEKAGGSLDEAIGMAADLPQPMMRTSVFETAAPLYAKFGSPENAREVCGMALETIGIIRSDSERAIALAALADVYRMSGLEPGQNEKEMITAILRTTLW
ncbi:MAG: tetratricopeptide repeat protein, partial [Pyrinomonadaceae bacterium]